MLSAPHSGSPDPTRPVRDRRALHGEIRIAALGRFSVGASRSGASPVSASSAALGGLQEKAPGNCGTPSRVVALAHRVRVLMGGIYLRDALTTHNPARPSASTVANSSRCAAPQKTPRRRVLPDSRAQSAGPAIRRVSIGS